MAPLLPFQHISQNDVVLSMWNEKCLNREINRPPSVPIWFVPQKTGLIWWVPWEWKYLEELNFYMELGSQEAQKRPNRYYHMGEIALDGYFPKKLSLFFKLWELFSSTFFGTTYILHICPDPRGTCQIFFLFLLWLFSGGDYSNLLKRGEMRNAQFFAVLPQCL